MRTRRNGDFTMTKPARIVDAHQHPFWHNRDDRGLVRDLDDHGIAYAWLLTWEIPPDTHDPANDRTLSPVAARGDGTHAGILLRDILTARDRYPDRFLAGYCPDPTRVNAPDLLRAAASIHGVRVCGEWKYRVLLDDPRCLELFRAAGELGLPVTVHIDVPYLPGPDGKPVYQPKWYGGTVANLERALQACPSTVFLGHAPGFWREISADADTDPAPYPKGPVPAPGRLYRLFDTCPNLYGDLSANSGRNALSRDPVNGRAFLLRYADRLLFARDNYGQDLHQFLQTLDLPQDVAEKIYFRNAEKLVPAGR
jgi:predicted TIM-barrel fold metal-dependent hydrolase